MACGIGASSGKHYNARVSSAYLDHAATAPLYPEAGETFLQVATELGNPNAIHNHGRNARRRLDEAREEIAEYLGADPAEVIFTSGGTESDNLAVHGGWFAMKDTRPGVITSAVEHPGVMETAHWLSEMHGAKHYTATVKRTGAIDLEKLREHLHQHGEQTALISVMWANNETGVIQPLQEITGLANEYGVAVHSDAVQAAAHIPIDFAHSGCAALSVSGHKLGAPVGIGVLLARRDFTPAPHMHGGLQERGIRSGTVNTAGAAALATALRITKAQQESNSKRMQALRDELQLAIASDVGEAVVWGQTEPRLPGHLLVSIPGTRSESVLFALDMAGISASAGSACQAGVVGASPVVLAMGGTEEEARSALRFTLGQSTTEEEIARVRDTLPNVVQRARAALAKD